MTNQTITSFIGWVGATVSFIWPTTIVGATLNISQAVAIISAISLINVAFIQTATAAICPWMIKSTRKRHYTTVWFTDQIKKTLGIAVARSFIESTFFMHNDSSIATVICYQNKDDNRSNVELGTTQLFHSIFKFGLRYHKIKRVWNG